MPSYNVVQGDCIFSIAWRFGISWRSVWNHPENASLQQNRPEPGVLAPGDIVFVPDREERNQPALTGAMHVFRVTRLRTVVRIQLLGANRRPRPRKPYSLQLGARVEHGTTDDEGRIEHPIDAAVDLVTLQVQDGSHLETYRIRLGAVDPIGHPDGARQRLSNLGLGGLSPDLAIRFLQKQGRLPENGEIDVATRSHLRSLHGC